MKSMTTKILALTAALFGLGITTPAMADVQSGTKVISYSDKTLPQWTTGDSTIYDYVNGAFNESGILEMAFSLNYNGKTASDVQGIFHAGMDGTGFSIKQTTGARLIFSIKNETGSSYQVGADLVTGDNAVICRFESAGSGTAKASVTLNGTRYDLGSWTFSSMNWNSSADERNKYSMGCRAPGWKEEPLTTSTIANNTITATYFSKVYTATISGDTTWSNINWAAPGLPVSGMPTSAEVTINNTAAAKLTMDKDVTVTKFAIQNAAGAALTLAPNGYTITATYDQSGAKGGVTIDASGDYGANIAKYAVAGAPYSYWYIRGSGALPNDPTSLPTLPMCYSVVAQKYTGYGMRLVVTAPNTAKFGSVNINIGNPSFVSGTDYGLYPAKGSDWTCLTTLKQDTWTTVGNVKVTANGEYGIDTLNNTTDAQKIFKQNMQDSAGNERGFTLKQLNQFADKYRVIVYMSSDTPNWGFAPVIISQYQGSTWNPVTYAGPAFQQNDIGYTIKGSTATHWGWANNNKSHCSLDQAEGVNAIVSDVMTADNIVIKSLRPSDDGYKARGSIAAIQIVKVGEVNVTYTATVSGNTSWSNISWTAPDGITPVTTANLPDSGDIRVTISSGATLTITAEDVTALTAKNIALKASKITNNGTIKFEGGTSSAPIAYTADGASNANEDLGTWTLASDTYVRVTADGNKIYKVTGQGDSSCLALTKSGGGIGLTAGSNLNDLTLVSEMPEGQKLWIERGIGNNVRLTANGAVHLSEGYKPTFVALNGEGTITRQNSTETLTIGCAENANYSGASAVPLTIADSDYVQLITGNYTGALTVNSGATVGLKAASPSPLTVASGAHLIIGANTSAAAINITGGTSGLNLSGVTLDIDSFAETAISESAATYKLASNSLGFSTDGVILGDSLTKGNWAVTVVGTELQAQKKTDSHYITIDPTTGEATHDTTSRLALDIDRTWIDEKCGTAGKSAEEVTAALNTPAANGTKPWESYVLGLDPNVETSVPVIQPAQAASSNGAIAFQLSNVTVNAKAGADVTYKVVTLSAPGGSEIESSESAAPGETISVALPTSGVTYYKLQVDIQ